MMYLITKWFGTFLCDINGVKKHIVFPKDNKEILKRLKKIENNIILSEERKIIKNFEVMVCEKRLQKIGELSELDPFFKKMNINPQDYGFSQELINEISVQLTKSKVEERLKSDDMQIIQMVNALDDLIKTSNLLSERLSCWTAIPTPDEKIDPFKKTLSAIDEEIKMLGKQIDDDMNRIAPNTSKIIGTLIAARLISCAGGINKLAVLPASTIQILGAEKALFRFKKEGGKPPKHGVIFQHHLINRSSLKERGKISRLLALKISVAIKADVFTKRDISDELIKDLNKQIVEIRNK